MLKRIPFEALFPGLICVFRSTNYEEMHNDPRIGLVEIVEIQNHVVVFQCLNTASSWCLELCNTGMLKDFYSF